MNLDTRNVGRTAGRYWKALAAAKGDPLGAAAYASSQGWLDEPAVVLALKSAVAIGTTTGSGAPLMTGAVADDFLAALRPRAVLSRLTAARRVKPMTRVITFDTPTTGYRVDEAAPKPLSIGALSNRVVRPFKHTAVTVASDELFKSMGPGGEAFVTDELASAAGQAEDGSLLSPSFSGSLTYSASSISSTGTTEAEIDADIKSLIGLLDSAKSSLVNVVLVMSPTTAQALAQLRGSGGAPAYPGIGPQGGLLMGLPVLTSLAAAGYIFALDQAGIVVADDGQSLRLDSTTEATIAMDSAPDSPTVASTVMTSLWAQNLIGLRAEIWRGFYGRPGSAAYISGVTY